VEPHQRFIDQIGTERRQHAFTVSSPQEQIMTYDPDPSPDAAAIDDAARPEQPPMDDDAGLAEDEAETLGDFA
jgi:hypothetical protein